jgi:hypothetical protein
MSLTMREFWTVFHGMGVGAVYLLAFAGGLAGLWSLRDSEITPTGLRRALTRMKWGMWTMAVTCWLTVISGTYVVYPWYRAPSSDSPRSKLVANPDTAAWHTFGMEWKEHVSWLSPILATAVLAMVLMYGRQMAHSKDLRNAALLLFIVAFAGAAVAGTFGAFINKIVPIL